MTPEIPTPETDALESKMVGSTQNARYYGTLRLARKLERERDAARAEIEAMRAAIEEAHKIIDVLNMDALDNHKENWPRANEWLQKHAAFANRKLTPQEQPYVAD